MAGETTDLLISMPDRPGELARAAEALGNAGINIQGASAVIDDEGGKAHLLVEDAGAARTALEQAGVTVEAVSDVVVVDIAEDRPGALGHRAHKLGESGVNVTFCYLATRGRFVFGVDDVDRAREALAVSP